MATDLTRWWGEFSLAEGRWAHFQIGPLSLLARRVPGEWRFAWCSGTNSVDERIDSDLEIAGEPDFTGRQMGRFALRDPGQALRIMPRLADRAFVVRPETPLQLLPDEETTLFVSTPLWVVLLSTGRAPNALTEVPSFRPSETWFGINTREGESCYAIKTSARTDSAQLIPAAHRAVTPIVIRNNGLDNLVIEQLRVPVVNLALYEAPDRRLWTDRVHFDREAGERTAELRISDSRDTEDRELIAEPRQPHSTSAIVQAFSRFFG